MANLSIDDMATFCKRKGFVYPSSEIYGGMAGFWDYGPLGVELFNNIKQSFWKFFVQSRENMVGIEASIISHPRTWVASGHVANFNVNDYLVNCKKCKKSAKIDKPELGNAKCECGGEYDWDHAKMVEQMFKTKIGTDQIEAYLRGETAQGMFLDFKLVTDTSRVKLPFGIVQVGRCFRNEIAPRDFMFRCREFHIGEFEFFIHPKMQKCDIITDEQLKLEIPLLSAEMQNKNKDELVMTSISDMIKKKKLDEWHGYWLAEQVKWFISLGLKIENLKIREHTKTELSHYSSATFDIDYKYPFGSKELAGNANRGQYDLNQHVKESSKDLSIFDEESKEKVIPRVIEPTFGMERAFLAVLCDAYEYDAKRENIVLHLHPKLAPIKVAVFPLVNKLEEKAREIFMLLKDDIVCSYDKSGSVGRRYARMDEIGTPYCVTIDFETIEKDQAVTIRDRDTTDQVRVKITELKETLKKLIDCEIKFQDIK
jgi:glycyl-tRNA synthetase